MSKISYTRRQVCQLGLSTLAGAAMLDLAACGGSTPTATGTGSSSPITVQLSFWGDASRNKLTQAAIKAFKKDGHSNTTVNTWFADFSSYFNKLNTQIAGGTVPDLIQMDVSYVRQYANDKQIMDLSSLIANKSIDLSDFDEQLLTNSKYNNILYGIPLGSNYECMIYNSTLAQQAGVGAPPTTWTWDDYASYTSKISKALSSKQIFGSHDASGAMDMFDIWVRQNGHETYTVDGKAGFTIDDITTWFEYWSALRKSGACASAEIQATVTGSGPATSLLAKGKAAFASGHSNQFGAYQKVTKDKLVLQLLPLDAGKQPGNFQKPSMLMSIGANSKNVQEAAAFIKFITTQADGVKAIGVDRGIPGSKHALEVITPTLKSADKATLGYSTLVTSNNQSRPKTVLDPTAAGKVLTDLTKVSQSVAFGKLTPAAGAAKFMANTQKTLAGS